MDAFVRRAAKALVLPGGMARRPRPADVAVLLYHRVGSGSREIDLDTRAFERQAAWLAENGRVIALDDALAGKSGVVLTFDDGTGDFHERVLPVLARHRIPATLYLATGGVRNGDGGGEAITWSQLHEVAASGLVAVGSHTHHHADLAGAEEGPAREEMRRSQELIEDRLGTPCRHFAYPFGRASRAAEHVARSLFDSAALGWGTNRGGRTDPFRLRRTPVLRNDGPYFFRAKVAGRLDGEALVYRLLRRGPWRPG